MRCEVRSDITWEQCEEEGEHDVHIVSYPGTENVLAWKNEPPPDQDGVVIPFRPRA